MKYLELFDILSTYGKSEISFPFQYKDGEDYIDCIDRLFHVYQDAIDKLDSNDIKILYLQPIITQYFIDNKSEIWLLFLIAHSKR